MTDDTDDDDDVDEVILMILLGIYTSCAKLAINVSPFVYFIAYLITFSISHAIGWIHTIVHIIRIPWNESQPYHNSRI